MHPDSVRFVPWDTEVFGLPCYEIVRPDNEALHFATKHPGHYTIKVDPLSGSKARLHQHGFYYVDTLIEPHCTADRLVHFRHTRCRFGKQVTLEELAPLCEQSFLHGRFHRDFNIPSQAADLRYQRWLEQMFDEGEVFGLYFERALAGFIACRGGHLTLHALAREWRGRGLAKYFWSAVCAHLFEQGVEVVRSSISAANLPVLNVYAQLGFRFADAKDVYHRLVS
ncbi:MAG: GNAT family N-acetyltransferase [Zetaproteobacteria bacterium]|nr:MAG: GNAT family N-acetyltransferase [Zetaproteobacteria bacterium]